MKARCGRVDDIACAPLRFHKATTNLVRDNLLVRAKGVPTIRYNNTTPTGFELLLLGISKTSWNGIPLPAGLPGIINCTLYVSIDVAVSVGYSSRLFLTIPMSQSLVGLEVYVQGMTLSGFPIIETSDAATIQIGN